VHNNIETFAKPRGSLKDIDAAIPAQAGMTEVDTAVVCQNFTKPKAA